MNLSLFAEAFMPLLRATGTTLSLALLSYAVGQVLGLLVALALVSRSRLVSLPAFLYTFCLRGSPLLVQVFLLYYALAQIEAVRTSILWPYLREPFFCAVLAIGLNSSAYVGELMRGAITNVARGQWEAAQVLGLGRGQAFVYIVLPQAYRAALPALGNEAILVLKATALASVITLMDVTGVARTLVADTYAPFEIFALAGLFYLAIGYVITRAFGLVEQVLSIPGTTPGRL
ncbi:ABC transporter permease [Bosea sp. Root483D1]|uniref:ABC transporter permease n=1 Tax=Bosea sp. Root483D1 TaxID=1736544 RepID=UPI0007100030|nr:ABC transporter permease subunit [Bosea sp. Root483D1]KRE17347.1 ABC transporter permease [Bosea sp. Root483D1]